MHVLDEGNPDRVSVCLCVCVTCMIGGVCVCVFV